MHYTGRCKKTTFVKKQFTSIFLRLIYIYIYIYIYTPGQKYKTALKNEEQLFTIFKLGISYI